MFKIIPFSILAFFVLSLSAQAQTWEVGGTTGASGYMGDFNPNNPLKFTDIALGAFVKRNFNGYLSAKGGYMYGTIQGSDAASSSPQLRARNLSFYSTLNEYSLIAELNFIRYIPEVGTNKFTPFLFAGIGTVGYAPKTMLNDVEYDLRTYTTEGQTHPYGGRAISIPYGAGIKYNFSGKWNLIIDLGYRNPNTPYLDDVYGSYPKTFLSPASSSLSNRTGGNVEPGTQRGNFRKNDTYMFAGFTISYTFVPINCPAF